MRLRTIKNLIGGIALSLFALCTAPAAFAQSTCAVPVYNGAVDIEITGNCAITTAININGPVKIILTSGSLTDTMPIQGTSVTIQTKTSGSVTLSDTVTVPAPLGQTPPNVSITSIDAVLLKKTVTATQGSFIASSQNSDVTVNGVTTIANYLQVNAKGNIKFGGKITSTTGGAILLTAGQNVLTKSIVASNATTAGAVQIVANTAGGNTPFHIGSATVNGVTGTITTNGTTNGGTSAYLAKNGVYIVNGTTNAGGITLDSIGAVLVKNSSSRSGFIILNAQDATLTLPAGTLSVDGVSGQYAGDIALVGKTIVTTGVTVLSATETNVPGPTGSNHYLWLSTSGITYGSSLTIHADGNRSGDNLPGTAILPVGALVINSNNMPNGLTVTVAVQSNAYQLSAPMAISGTGNFTATADGDYSGVGVAGYPLSFSGGAVTIHSRGTLGVSPVFVGYEGTFSNKPGIAFNGTGAVAIDSNAVPAATGTAVASSLTIVGDQFVLNAPSHSFTANGPSSQNGNGGMILFYGQTTTLKATSTATLAANAASAGTGDAVYNDPTTSSQLAIRFYPGTIAAGFKLGTGAGQFFFSANGGSSGGNAGTVSLNPNASVSVLSAGAMTASALGGDGNGGWLYINGTISGTDVNFVNNSLTATGHGSGNGGQVTASHTLTFLDVNKKINVNGGTSAVSSEGGTIQLNNITCHQYLTAYLPWPTGYWDCANNSPTASDKEPAAFAKTKMPGALSTLKNGNTYIYVFHTYSDLGPFFNVPATSDMTSATFQADPDPTTGYIYSSFLEQDGNGVAYTINQLDQFTPHELGHALNDALGHQANFGTVYDTAWARRDFFYLDFTDAAGANPRNPCANYVSGGVTYPAPFGNISAVCTAGVLNSSFAGMSNSKISMQISLGVKMYYVFTAKADPDTGVFSWGELYANAVAFNAYDNSAPPSTWNYTLADQVIANGYFGCTKAWGQAVLTGAATPPSTYPTGLSCGVNVPQSYTPGT